jgi:DNA-directed RNA polymerase subunit beta'
MGCFYITLPLPSRKGEGMIFSSVDEAEIAYNQGVIDKHAMIKVRLRKDQYVRRNEEERTGPGLIIDTTYGRILFNSILPRGMDFYNYLMKSGDLAAVAARRSIYWTI